MFNKAIGLAEVKYKNFESNSLLGAVNQLNHWLRNHAVNVFSVETINAASGWVGVAGGTVGTEFVCVRLWYQVEQLDAKAKPENTLKTVNKDLEAVLSRARVRAEKRKLGAETRGK